MPPVGDDTQTVEYSVGELVAERNEDTEDVTEDDELGVEVGMKLTVLVGDCDKLLDDDMRDPLADVDGVTLMPVVGDTDGVSDCVKGTHCAKRMKVVDAAQPPPPDCVSTVAARMEHELSPRHVELTMAPFPAAPGHDPSTNGPDGHAPVGLP